VKRMAALCGALLMTLVLAAPAAANEKVHVDMFSASGAFETPIVVGTCNEATGEGWCEPWQCEETIYYGGTYDDDLWLWYKNGVAEADRMPEFGAWPWIRGQSTHQGIDYFSSRPDMGGKVLSGKYKYTVHMDKHYLGDPTVLVDDDPAIWADPETWVETASGKYWGVTAPGVGPVAFMTSSESYRVTVVDQSPGEEEIGSDSIREWRGKMSFKEAAICDYFGLGVEYP